MVLATARDLQSRVSESDAIGFELHRLDKRCCRYRIWSISDQQQVDRTEPIVSSSASPRYSSVAANTFQSALRKVDHWVRLPRSSANFPRQGMKRIKKRYSEEQIIGLLQVGEAAIAVNDLCSKHGFAEAKFAT